VQSRGNRDGRPVYTLSELRAMGYRGCIDAQLLLGVAVHFIKEALAEMLRTGRYTGIGDNQFTTLRKDIEDMIGLDSHYEVEADTVEKSEA
jgi:2-methylisocitrate lyase-like PEP mutase family enzyme